MKRIILLVLLTAALADAGIIRAVGHAVPKVIGKTGHVLKTIFW